MRTVTLPRVVSRSAMTAPSWEEDLGIFIRNCPQKSCADASSQSVVAEKAGDAVCYRAFTSSKIIVILSSDNGQVETHRPLFGLVAQCGRAVRVDLHLHSVHKYELIERVGAEDDRGRHGARAHHSSAQRPALPHIPAVHSRAGIFYFIISINSQYDL